jgi:hypothetical protein
MMFLNWAIGLLPLDDPLIILYIHNCPMGFCPRKTSRQVNESRSLSTEHSSEVFLTVPA